MFSTSKDSESEVVFHGTLAADKVAATSNPVLQVALHNELKRAEF